MNRMIIRHGFIVILLGLLGGFAVPAMKIPRLGVSAHTIGVLSGVLLISVGAVWQQFRLSEGQLRVMAGSWLYAGYVNWLGVIVAGFAGTGRATPVASGGVEGEPMMELVVMVMLVTVGIASLLAAILSLIGLRKAPDR